MDADVCNRVSSGFLASQRAQPPLQRVFNDYVSKFRRNKTGNCMPQYTLMCSLNLFGFSQNGMLLLPPGLLSRNF